MKREIFKEGSTYAGIGLIFSGIAAALGKDYASAFTQIASGIGAIFHK